MSAPSSTSRRRTSCPAGPVWCVTSFMPSIFAAMSRTSSIELRDLHAAALAAAAGVDLRLHDPHLAAELLRRLDRLVDGERGNAARRGHAVLAEDFLALVFVDVHGRLARRACADGSPGPAILPTS